MGFNSYKHWWGDGIAFSPLELGALRPFDTLNEQIQTLESWDWGNKMAADCIMSYCSEVHFYISV